MFRITTHTADDRVVLKLEGGLAAAWVPELDACWRAAAEAVGGQHIQVDLTAVSGLDDAGRELLTRMYRGGSRFVTRGCVMPEILREIAASCVVPPTGTRRS